MGCGVPSPAALQQALAEMAYARAAAALAAAGIETLVLKGPHLGSTVYPDPLDRPYGDVDLLVRPEHFARAVATLGAEGFRLPPMEGPREASEREYYCYHLTSPDGTVVELHRALAGHGRYPVDAGDLFERSEPFRFGETPARGLGPEDLLLHLCIHMAKSYFRSVERKHVTDMAALIRARHLDWETFVLRAREAGCATGSHLALEAARRQDGAPVPEEALWALRPGPIRRGWLRLVFDLSRTPSYRWLAHPMGLVQALVALPLVDEVRRWPGLLGRYLHLRLLDLRGRVRGRKAGPEAAQ